MAVVGSDGVVISGPMRDYCAGHLSGFPHTGGQTRANSVKSRARRTGWLCIAWVLVLFAIPRVTYAQDKTGAGDEPASRPGQSKPGVADRARMAPDPAEQSALGQADVDWDRAPLATEAGGIARAEERGPIWLLWIPRVVFFVPRWALFIAASPVRLSAYLYERYQLRDRFDQIFFNVDGTFGIFPVAFFETGFGLNVGLRVVHKDLFGKAEGLRLRAGYGGRFQQIYAVSFNSGDRLSERIELDVEVRYEIRPREPFFGIGNGDEGQPGTMIDAINDDTAVKSLFRQRVARFMVGAKTPLVGDLSAVLSSAFM